MDRLIEENMVLNIEGPYHELGFSGPQLKDSIVFAKGGYKFTILPCKLRACTVSGLGREDSGE